MRCGPRVSHRLLVGGVFGHHLDDNQQQAQKTAPHADYRFHSAALGGVEVIRHSPAQHHHRPLPDMGGKPGLTVHMGEYLGLRGPDDCR